MNRGSPNGLATGEAAEVKGPAGERRGSEPRTPDQGWPGWTSSEAGKRSDEVSPAELRTDQQRTSAAERRNGSDFGSQVAS